MGTGPQNSLPDWNEIIEAPKLKPTIIRNMWGKASQREATPDMEADQPTRFPPVRTCTPMLHRNHIHHRHHPHRPNRLDVLRTRLGLHSHSGRKLEKVSLNQNIDADTTRIAKPQSGDVPVDGMPTHTQVIGWMYIPKNRIRLEACNPTGNRPNRVGQSGHRPLRADRHARCRRQQRLCRSSHRWRLGLHRPFADG